MPIYSYKCWECGEVADIFLRSMNSEVRCPNCGSENLEKLFSSSYIIRGETVGSEARAPGTTCCGRTERCDTPPCSTNDVCRRR